MDPEGYFIFSDGSNKNEILDSYPPVRLLKPKGIDINFDGIINPNELGNQVWSNGRLVQLQFWGYWYNGISTIFNYTIPIIPENISHRALLPKPLITDSFLLLIKGCDRETLKILPN